MENAQKAIMIGVGLFITIIIISAVLLITNIGTDLINNSKDELTNISTVLQNQVIAAYDGKTLSGGEVVAACQLYENSDMSILISAKVEGGTGRYNLHLGKYKIDVNTAGNITPTITTELLPGGYLYSGNLTRLTATDRTTMTELQKPANGTARQAGVAADKTYYSAIIRDSETNTVIGMLFREV